MPLYEYQCPRCGRFELIQKFSDAPLRTCPTCGKDVQKLLSAPAIQFKGTGWYVTDYARKPAGPDSATKGSESKPSGSSSESSTDATSGTASKDAPAAGSSPTK